MAGADGSVQNVKLNGWSKAGSGSSVNIHFGNPVSSYHLLEFVFAEKWAGGKLHFYVATDTEDGDYAWLSRFRVYVPDYSDTEY